MMKKGQQAPGGRGPLRMSEQEIGEKKNTATRMASPFLSCNASPVVRSITKLDRKHASRIRVGKSG